MKFGKTHNSQKCERESKSKTRNLTQCPNDRSFSLKFPVNLFVEIILSHWGQWTIKTCNCYQHNYFNTSCTAAQVRRKVVHWRILSVCLLAVQTATCLHAEPVCSLILSLFSSPPLPTPGCNSGIHGTASLRAGRPSSAPLTSALLPPWPPTRLLSPHPCFHNLHSPPPRLCCYEAHTSSLPQMPRSDPFGGSYHPPCCQKGRRRQTERPFSNPAPVVYQLVCNIIHVMLQLILCFK